MKLISLNGGILAGFVAATLAGCSGDALFYRTDGTYTADVTTETSAAGRKTLTMTNLVATTADGRMVKLENGTFTFLIYIRKSPYSPLS